MNKESITKKIGLLALALLLLSSVFVVFPSSTPTAAAQTASAVPNDMLQYEWTMASSDNSLSYSSAGPAPSSFNIAWKAKIPGVTGAPIAFGGLVFVQSASRTYALNGANGDIVWDIAGTGSLAKIDDTYMMKGSDCIRIADGSTVWTGPAGFTWNYYASDLKMFICSKFGWSLPDPSQPPTLAWNRTNDAYYGIEGERLPYADGKLFVGTMNNFVECIDAKTGTTLWVTSATSQFWYRGTYCDGKVIFGGLDNNMYAWDANTGNLEWTYNPGTWYGQWASAAASAYGLVFEHNQDTYLYAINASTGELVWKAKGPGVGYSGLLTIGGGKVYSLMGEYQYRDFETGEYAHSEYNCYDALTGELIWSAPIETGGGPSIHECIAYGNLYIIPIPGSPQKPGIWEYSSSTLDEVWCISSETKDWSMLLSDTAHTGEGAGPTDLALKWKFTADSSIQSSAAVVDGTAYFASMAGTVYAVDAETGAAKWQYPIGSPMKSSVAVANGKVFTGSDDGNVYCLDAATGNKLWQADVGGVKINPIADPRGLSSASDVRASPIVYGNKVYVGALDGNLYCLDMTTGAISWKYQTGGPIIAAATIADNAVFVPSCTQRPDGTLYKLDLNGNLVWKIAIPYVLNATAGAGYWLCTAPTYADGMVFLRNAFRLNYGIDAATGEILWTYDGQYNPGTPSQLGGVLQINAMLYSYGKLYFNDFYGITCLNAKNGSVIWTTWLSRENLAQGLAYSYGRIYTVNELGALYVLDALTGDKISVNTDFGSSQMRSAPSLYTGNLYVGANDWNLRCFGEARTMNTAASASPVSPSPMPSATPEATPVISEASPIPTTSSVPTNAPTAPAAANTPAAPAVTDVPSTSQESTDSTTTIYIVITVVVIVAVIAAAILLTKRK
jgi:outer membrane protein assembly factor BamB